MKKMFARMLALAMTCVVLLTGCGQNPSSSVSGSGGNGSGVQSSGDWPKQPVNVICPASAGGGTDLILRTINEYFTRMTGQPFVVNNITGLTGYEMIHQGTTDGYDFIMGTTTIFTSELDGTLDYDWNDYEMVAFIEGDFNTVIADTCRFPLSDDQRSSGCSQKRSVQCHRRDYALWSALYVL